MAAVQNQQSSYADPSACTFPLGGDVFLSCNIFMNKTLIHVRRHKKSGDKHYPTKEGVTLTRHQFMVLTGSSCLKAKSTDKKVDNPLHEFFVNMPPQLDPITVYSETTAGIRDYHAKNELLITFSTGSVTLERVSTSSSGQTYSRTVTIDDQQWSRIFTESGRFLTALCNLQLCCVQFKELFQMISGYSAPKALSISDIAYKDLSTMLQAEIRKVISEYPGIHNSSTDEACQSSLYDFNTAVLDLDLYHVVRNFYTAAKNSSPFSLIEYVTVEFLESVNIHEIIQNVRSELCKN